MSRRQAIAVAGILAVGAVAVGFVALVQWIAG